MVKGCALINGYLPVRLTLPTSSGEGGAKAEETTFFYIREHHVRQQDLNDKNEAGDKSGKGNKANASFTLFVANAPIVPGVSTQILLKSLLGRTADVVRIAVVDSPRKQSEGPKDGASSNAWTKNLSDPTFLPTIYSEGKFAHVVYRNPKDMKRTLRELEQIMSEDGDDQPGLSLEEIEIQTLVDTSQRHHRTEVRKRRNLLIGDAEDDESDDDMEDTIQHDDQNSGVLAVAQQYLANRRAIEKSILMKECDAVMQAYEESEQEKKRQQELLKSQPDDDGFVAVSYSSAIGSKVDLEEQEVGLSRRKGSKRSRKKKQGTGSSELGDFYRFQRKENRKRSLDDLRKQFEEDLQKVKKMKDDRQYRPF